MLVRVIALSLVFAAAAGIFCWRRRSFVASWLVFAVTVAPWGIAWVTRHGEDFFGFLLLLLPASIVSGLVAWHQTCAEQKRRRASETPPAGKTAAT